MVLSEEKLYSVGRRWVYIFNRRKAKKEIPGSCDRASNGWDTVGQGHPPAAARPFSPIMRRNLIGLDVDLVLDANVAGAGWILTRCQPCC